jgi:hypothetical protein
LCLRDAALVRLMGTHLAQVFTNLSFMGVKWDIPNCAWDGKACMTPVKPKFVKQVHAPVMNLGSAMGASIAAKVLAGQKK